MHPPSTLPLRSKLSSSNLLDPPTPSTPHGFRAQINQLIPKHSYFRTRVVIHQIDSVPFVSGQFSVRWRFKHVHSPPTQRQGGLLGMVKTRSKNGDKHLQSGDDPDNSSSAVVDPSVPSLLISNDSSSNSSSARVPSFSSAASTSSSSSGPGIGIGALAAAAYSITARSTYSEPPSFSSHANASRSTLHLPAAITVPAYSHPTPTPPTPPFPPSFADASSSQASHPHPHPPPPPPSVAAPSFTPARGNTPYLDLKDHSVHWNQTLSTVVRLDVDRDTGYILPCPFKLVVMQRVRHDDPELFRLGALYLNLSEYVGHGPVERRYLLRESKTNATLKLTIELEYVSGETHYIPPPLPKGEILNGLSGYLKGELRTVTRGQTVDIYGPYRDQDELELDLFGIQPPTTTSTTSTTTITTTSTTATTARRIRYLIDDDDSDADNINVEDDDDDNDNNNNNNTNININSTAGHEATQPTAPVLTEPAFDVERLPMAYGTKTTETLIEAIFNPVRTFERRCESPFTVYVSPPPPPPPLPSSQRARSGDARGATITATTATTATSEVESVYSTESSSAASSGSGSGSGSGAASINMGGMSQSGHGSDTRSMRSTSGGGGGRVKDWWRKIGPSRPSTPVGLGLGGTGGGR